MSGSRQSRRDQLIEARDALRRQIDVLDAGPVTSVNNFGEGRQFRDQADQLRAMLSNIEDQLSELGVSESQA